MNGAPHSHSLPFRPAGEAVVTVSCLKHTYPDTTEVHICGLDFVVNRGERVVVLGGNGSGKTTLLYHILGLLRPDEGKVEVFGRNPATEFPAIRERIGVLLQNVDEQILSPTVREDISFSPRNYGVGREETARMVDGVMAELGIARLADKICHYLSGGEKRKVALAGALVMRPDLLILDEPFEGLDTRSRSELVELLNRRNRDGMGIIMSTHDLNLVGEFADRVYVLVAAFDSDLCALAGLARHSADLHSAIVDFRNFHFKQALHEHRIST